MYSLSFHPKAKVIASRDVSKNKNAAARNHATTLSLIGSSPLHLPEKLQMQPSSEKIPGLRINSEETLSHLHEVKLREVRSVFFEEEMQKENLDRILSLIDLLQRSGIDHHFSEEIKDMLEVLHKKRFQIIEAETDNLVRVSLLFRLLRQARYPISSDIFCRFLDDRGDFLPSLTEQTKGMINLFEASFMNTGEEILYRANDFTTDHFRSSTAASDSSRFIKESLESPYHLSLQRYKARQYLDHCRHHQGDGKTSRRFMIQELARMDFVMNQSLHGKELNEILSWWKRSGLAEELRFARDQCLKWYTWSLTTLPNPKLSSHRIGLTKVIAFVYLLDDIFDVRGTLDELQLLTEAIHKWELSAVPSLPTYMRACYEALYDTTNEVARMAFEEHGRDPIERLKKSWMELSDAFLLEAKWFAGKQVPGAEEYTRNGMVSCGVPLVLLHLCFLLGQGPALDETARGMGFVETLPKLISCPSMILRLWDDLGSAEDEEQVGFDGSILECLMKENPHRSRQSAREHVMRMISKAWEELNKESFDSSTSFSQDFVTACLNMARMVRAMYSYDDDHKLPMLEKHISLLLLENV